MNGASVEARQPRYIGVQVQVKHVSAAQPACARQPSSERPEQGEVEPPPLPREPPEPPPVAPPPPVEPPLPPPVPPAPGRPQLRASRTIAVMTRMRWSVARSPPRRERSVRRDAPAQRVDDR